MSVIPETMRADRDWVIACALLLAGCATAARRLEPAPAARVSPEIVGEIALLHHEAVLSIVEPSSLVTARGTLRLIAREPTNVVILDVEDLAIDEVRAAGRALRFVRDATRLVVRMNETLAAGDTAELSLTWRVPRESRRVHFGREHVFAGYHAAGWLPTRHDPAQRATLDLTIEAPADWVVVASGRAAPARHLGDGRTAHRFVLDRGLPPFLYAFAAGRFAIVESRVGATTLRAIGAPGLDLDHALAVTAPMVEFFERRIGRPYPGNTYTQVFVDGDEAQEAAGMALLSASAIAELRATPTEDWLFSHELAHQWFGVWVSCEHFGDFWLNEGFATFMVAAYKEERWGRDAYDREVALWRTRSMRVHAEGTDAPLSASSPLSESALPPRGVTYARGALVLDRLRRELGDDAFWDGIRRYVEARAGRSARSEHLREAFEAASGRDLEAFFATHVYAVSLVD